MHFLPRTSFVFPGIRGKGPFTQQVLSQHALFGCPITSCVSADPGALLLFTTELGDESGQGHGKN